MKIKFIAHSQAPSKYSFNGEKITAFTNDKSEEFDVSGCEEGGKFLRDWQPQILEMTGTDIIADCQRIDDLLQVTLLQRPPVTKITYFIGDQSISLKPTDSPPDEFERKMEWRGGVWGESDWIDSTDYNENELYIKQL